MHIGIGSSTPIVDDVNEASDAAPTSDVPLSELATTSANVVEAVPTADGTHIDDGET